MGYLSGQHGRMYIKAANASGYNEVARVRNWSVNFQQSVLDSTALTDTDRTIVAGLRSFTGSATLFYYEESSSNVKRIADHFIDTGGTDYSSKTFGVNTPPELVKMELRLSGATSRDIEFYAMISTMTITCATGEIVSADISFEGHGAPSQFNY